MSRFRRPVPPRGVTPRGLPRLGGFLIALLLTAVLGANAPLAALEVGIVSPPAGAPVFGEVELVVEVESDSPPVRLELQVDGVTVARLTSPPWRVRLDVGQANTGHIFEAMAEDASGSRVHRVLETPAVRVDDALELALRQLYVTVTRGGEAVLDLPREAFTVRDEGKAQRIVTFERGDIPMTALLLVDASDSMRGRRLAAALAGARAFTRAMHPLDQASLLLFSDRVLHRTPFTGFAEVLEVGLGAVSAGGGTALADHLYLGLQLLEERQGRRVLVVLSDGVDVASGLTMAQVGEVARRSSARVYWIRLGAASALSLSCAWKAPEAMRREAADLERLVAESGGRVVPLPRLEDAVPAFAEVLREIRDQYVLGYYPSARRRDGSWHRVAVRAAGPGLTVRLREGYVDE